MQNSTQAFSGIPIAKYFTDREADTASPAEVKASQDAHDGTVTAGEVRRFVAEQAPTMLAPDAIVPPADDVARVVSPTVLQMKGKDGAPGAALMSNMPLAVQGEKTKDNPSGLELADLDWKLRGDRIEVKDSPVSISLPTEADGTVRFGDLSAKLVPDAADTTPSITNDAVTYPNVAPDRDLVVRSTPLGVKIAWTLRSPDAKREIRVPFSVPTGGKLVKNDNGSIDILDADDKKVGSLSTPVANDANQKGVPLDVDIDGNEVVISVKPDEAKTVWPVVVDPLAQTAGGSFDQGSDAQNSDQYNWFQSKSRDSNPIYSSFINGGPGAYSAFGGFFMAGYAGNYGTGQGTYYPGDYASWNRYAPGDTSLPVGDPQHAYFFRFDGGGIYYSNANGWNAPTGGYGLLNANGTGQAGQHFRAQNTGGTYANESYAPTIYDGPARGWLNGTNGGGASVFSGSNIDDYQSGKTDPNIKTDNIAAMSIQDLGDLGGNRRPDTQFHMGWYRLYAMDKVAPTLTGGDNSSANWTKSPPTALTNVTTTDRGLGVSWWGVSDDIPTSSNAAGTVVDSAAESCPPSKRALCPFTPASRSFNVGTVPEGRHTYTLFSIDPGGNGTPKFVPFAVDRNGPLIEPTGALYTDRSSPIRGGLTRPLTVTATDGDPNGAPAAQRSGVQSIKVFVDDKQVASTTQTVSGDSKPLSLTWKPVPGAFTKGDHKVRIESLDRAGNAAAVSSKSEFTVTGGCCGTTAGQRPDDSQISDSLNQRTSYGVSVVTGNLLVSSSDVSISGLGSGLQLTRYYNSVHNGSQGLHGDGFTTDLTADVRVYDVDGSDDKTLRFGDGQVYRYKKKTDAAGYTTPDDLEAGLEKETDSTYTLTFPRSKTKWKFTTAGKLKSITDKNDNKTTLDYTASGVLNKITDANGRDLTVTLNAEDRIGKLTDVAGREWIYTYGGPGNKYLASYTDPTNCTTTYRYDTQNRMDRIVSPGGRALRITYTNNGPQDRVESLIRETADGTNPTTTFDYAADTSKCDSGQQATVVTDPRGNKTIYCITVNTLRARKAIDAKGHERAVDYTSLGQVATFSDGGTGGSTTTNTFDTSSNSLKKSTGPEGEQSLYDYGTDVYRPQKSMDADQKERNFGYDAQTGQVNSVRQKTAMPDQDSAQMSATLAYNTDGTIKTAKDGLGRTTSYSYFDGTKAGMLKTYDPPGDLGDTTFEYDALGRTKKVTDGRGKVTSFEYDNLDQNTKTTFDGGSIQTTVLDSDGNVKERNDTSTGNYLYSYDELNRRKQETLPGGRTVAYTYDKAGNLATLTDGSGTTSYGYNNVNQNCYVAPQSSNSSADCLTPPANAIGLEYDVRGFPSARHYPAANSSDRVDVISDYGKSGRAKSIIAKRGSTTLATRTYTYNEIATGQSGRLLKTLDKGSQGTVNYTYDAIGQLKTAEGGAPRPGNAAGDLSYTYDYAGNRKNTTCKVGTSDSSTVSMTYNDSNQLTDASKTGTICGLPSPATTFTYDKAGGDKRFDYNDRGQTTTMAGHTLAYGGADQNELVKDDDATIENSLLGETRKIVAGDAVSYIRGINGEIYGRRTQNGTYRYYVQDALGSVIATTGSTGEVVDRYDYDPDGNSVAMPQDFGFTGAFASGTSSSWRYHNGQRWYDPQTARWTQTDSLDNPTDLRQANRYAYAGGDPVNIVDPTGQLFGITGQDVANCGGGALSGGLLGLIGGATAIPGALYGCGTAVAAGRLGVGNISNFGGAIQDAFSIIDSYINQGYGGGPPPPPPVLVRPGL